MNDLYYGPDSFMPVNVAATPIDLSNAVQKALKDIYSKRINPYTEIHPELFRGFADTFDLAAAKGFGDAEELTPEFRMRVVRSNEVFSAFKAHRMQQDIASRLLDDEGNLKTFARFKEDIKDITSHQCGRWLRTEYDTAVKRASLAADWQRFEREKDVLPNLRWVPSTAATPEAVHMSLWNTVLPVDHPFWSAHRPGDRWGCQCSLEATDDPVTPSPTAGYRAAPGLDNNPGKDGRLFSDTHPYFPDDCQSCPFYGRQQSAAPTNKVKDCGNCKYIEKILQSNKVEISGIPEKYEYFGEGWIQEFRRGDGYLVTESTRIPAKKTGNEWEKYLKEHTMCANFANAGHRMVHLREREGLYDVLCDGKPADLKKTRSVNNLDHYVDHALRDQKAELVLIEFEEENKDVYSKLRKYKMEGKHILYYFSGREDNIYTI
ncbi:MAG: hypothetical protein KBS67_05455 [Bacteroidales bacterium]|nr:hypothetical protein [Candidatus Cryptobacteroides equifaecalis]